MRKKSQRKNSQWLREYQSQHRHQGQRRRLPQSLGPQVNILHFELVTKGEPQGVAAPSFVQHLVVTKVGQSDIVT